MEIEKEFEEIVEAPAIALEDGIEILGRAEHTLLNKKPFRMAKEYANTLGPGLTTGAADDDPSGIATYSQVGAQTGFGLIWLSLFSFPLMATVQEMCARIGIVTGKGLAANIRERYSPSVLYGSAMLLFVANVFNIGADLGAMAKSTQLVFPTTSFPLLIILFAVVSLILQIFTTYARYAAYLKYLTLVLFAYVVTAFLVHINWYDAFMHTVIPTLHFDKETILIICAVLGTTISPYLFFWQTSQELEMEEVRKQTHPRISIASRLRDMRMDVWSGMFFSNIIMFFIIAVCASVFAQNGITTISTADEAALALRPLAGNFASLLFALGIIGTGMLAVPVLAGSASYAISESFRWDTGLYRKLKDAYAFYGVIILAMLAGLAINFVGLDPIRVLIYSAVANGIIAPVFLFFVVRLSSDKKLMHAHANGPLTSAVGWLTVIIMAVIASAVITL